MVTDYQAPEYWRRSVDHGVGERKPALRSDGGIILALQNLDQLLLHMLRWLYGLDGDKHKNITSTTCYVQSIHIHAMLYQVHVRDVNMPTCWAYWLPGNHKNMTSTTCYVESIHIQSFTSRSSTSQRRKHADMLCVLVIRYPTAKQHPKFHDNETNNEYLHEYLRYTAW